MTSVSPSSPDIPVITSGIEAQQAGEGSGLLGCPTGTYEYYFDSGAFLWSDEMYDIHGYERGEVVPSLELGLTHVDPADRTNSQRLMGRLTADGGPIAGYHTIIDARKRRRQVLSVGDLITDDDGKTIGIRGMLADLTKSIHDDTHRLANRAVAESAARRAVIEQAKGILMGAHRISADDAFAAINARSQDTNRKVHDIAQDIVDATAP
ncbi:PAS and ANTAR domain-containing protein [Arthrobacter burdickii]|uniref:PAS and ANTAR domain-containing protein n=1 Tax=Arthrobacter burdickii TaxID=3035920 RepID=A0ABT8JYU0_9MICC|nr:PAS and ANTAR domain-containing protein [Arthrobacter burdickii]MDN4609527.1 PAS and ANTAR domain-containing protein [Arthrobacter burdickii]